ncbi:hypothetical protein DXV75_01275 [Alteromonas aestuariivivens]|uniref:DUF3386 family protein n=1 Tax=Alteromonas aestuariivivens TaxID=1938339 RepID=A0A3D8MEE7_9ALTE|nr:hypothetical protein [Alteromonas aestuariivivens]RDV29122.1 hypothetical protein DXV75_01275 [Alteromonas aestuariivivens]
MKLSLTASSLVLGLSVSVGANAVDLVPLEQFPEWFKTAMAREAEVKNTTELAIEALNVKHKVLGNAELVEQGDGYWYYSVGIGSDTPVECYVLTEFDGTASSLYSIVSHSVKGAEAINKKTLSSTFNYAMDIGLIGDTPYMLLDTMYSLGEGNEKVSGVLKGLSAQTDNSLQICVHNELGYRDTFLTVFKSFVGAFLASDTDAEFFEPIYQLSFNGLPVGYSREKYTTDQDGDIRIINESAMMLPVNANSVSRSDTVSTTWSRPDGSIINATEYSVENDVLASEFSLAIADDRWQVNGQMQGKPISATLEYNDWLISGFGSYQETANLLKSEQQASEVYMWSSDADPTSALKITLTKIADDPNANIQIDMGPIVMKVMADDLGVIQRGTLSQGPISMQMELLHVSGEPKWP